MTEVYWRMLSDEDDDLRDKCKERRRRRIEMRRLAAISAAGSILPASENRRENSLESSSSSVVVAEVKRIRTAERPESASSRDDVEAPAVRAQSEAPAAAEPVYGTMSVSGRSREMEDAIAVKTSLCRPEINRRRPVHFFGVYDGHGGPHVAALCRERMHLFLEDELTRVVLTERGASGDGEGSSSNGSKRHRGGVGVEREQKWEAAWKRVMKRTFKRMDEVALTTCGCGSVGYCSCHPLEVAVGGSTAVLALLTAEHIIVANCGDSRAVLCRGGKAIPLSNDHKPERSDELARIEAAGGRVIFVNGARVEGILAMSRAIGSVVLVCYRRRIQCCIKPWKVCRDDYDKDGLFWYVAYGIFNNASPQHIPSMKMWHKSLPCVACIVSDSRAGVGPSGDKFLKPVVISEPEITFTKREPEDECLILASDGLWDVLSSDLACAVAHECLREVDRPSASANSGSYVEDEGDGALYPSQSTLAAALLTRLALGRRSSDNISVIVVDLKRRSRG